MPRFRYGRLDPRGFLPVAGIRRASRLSLGPWFDITKYCGCAYHRVARETSGSGVPVLGRSVESSAIDPHDARSPTLSISLERSSEMTIHLIIFSGGESPAGQAAPALKSGWPTWASPSTCCRAVNLRNPSTREYRENQRKMPGCSPDRASLGAASSASREPESRRKRPVRGNSGQ